MTKKDLEIYLKELIREFKDINGWEAAEDNIQAHTTLKLLEFLGYKYTLNTHQEIKTGKKPDILLKGNVENRLLVVESKGASSKDTLDGSYKNSTFQQQLINYCKAEGLYWGVLTNFIEWRMYSVYQNRLYGDRKYAFYDLLWPNANSSDYINLMSEDGISFIYGLRAESMQSLNGRWNNDPIYYPKKDEIKEDFFIKLKSWRTTLRAHIYKFNADKCSIDDIDLMTQKIIDRLIFIDYCADNSILSPNALNRTLYSKQSKWNELKNVFNEINDRFNTELFTLSACDTLNINDETIIPIIQDLSIINFKQFSVSIIGEVYENYLGEMLKQNRGKIKVENEKATEKKKSQGIYYTPEYIVNYMVETTVGNLLARCKTEKEIEKIRVLDPACGSGSFLIRIFDEFKNHYERIHKDTFIDFEIRKKILQNNIYGVDIDARAVEIAKLNLMIKALEGIKAQDLKGKKLLPNLELNIRCGNSLIAGEMQLSDDHLLYPQYQELLQQLVSFREKFNLLKDDDDKKSELKEIFVKEETINSTANKGLGYYFKNLEEINPFNYPCAFPKIFLDGGFDIVIGNPPYLNVELVPEDQKNYFSDNYDTFFKRYDEYALFFDAGLTKLTNSGGRVAFIIPQQIFNNLSYKKLRSLVLDNQWLDEVCYVGDKVFADARNDVCILFLDKSQVKKIRLVNAIDFDNPTITDVPMDYFSKSNNVISFSYSPKSEGIFDKIFNPKHNRIADSFDVFQGIVTGNNDAFLPTNDSIKRHEIEDELLYPVLLGRDFEKWFIRNPDRRIIYVNKETAIEKYPHALAWLSSFKTELAKRRECKNKVIPWFSLQWPRMKNQLDYLPKILVQGTRNPRLKNRIIATIDKSGVYGTQGLNFIVPHSKKISVYYLIGILNSSLINYLYTTKFLNVAIKAEYLKETPISNCSDEDKNSMEALVKRALKTRNEIELKSIEEQIDKIVFKIYNLSYTEISIIKGS